METSDVLPLIDQCPEDDSLRADVLDGLRRNQKSIPSKYLYDARGSQLFDAICELEEYYPTRTELAIMTDSAAAMTATIGSGALVVEYGSGSSLKTRVLLDHLDAPAGYVPIDISREHLVQAAEDLAQAYPDVPVQPVCADYTGTVTLPDPPRTPSRIVVYYPGSTIGNFRPEEAKAFLERIAQVAGPGGGLLIGVDLKKDVDLLHAAYNDAEGVTAEFNLNVLRRLNRELDATFDLDAFRHDAVWNDAEGCIEMFLVSTTEQTVDVDGVSIAFDAGERIHTEYSYKYTLDDFAALAARSGLAVEHVWTDPNDLFSVQYCTVDTW